MSEAHEKDKQVGEEEQDVEEEEYVLLELGNCLYSDISPGAPFVLSGLDTLTPTLIVGDDLKMIGEYEETVGKCYLFSESETQPKPSAEIPPSGEDEAGPASSSKEALSKECGVISPRFDVGVKEIEGWTARLLRSRQFGYIVLTTSAGIMDHEEARRKNVGGKVLGFFY